MCFSFLAIGHLCRFWLTVWIETCKTAYFYIFSAFDYIVTWSLLCRVFWLLFIKKLENPCMCFFHSSLKVHLKEHWLNYTLNFKYQFMFPETCACSHLYTCTSHREKETKEVLFEVNAQVKSFKSARHIPCHLYTVSNHWYLTLSDCVCWSIQRHKEALFTAVTLKSMTSRYLTC